MAKISSSTEMNSSAKSKKKSMRRFGLCFGGFILILITFLIQTENRSWLSKETTQISLEPEEIVEDVVITQAVVNDSVNKTADTIKPKIESKLKSKPVGKTAIRKKHIRHAQPTKAARSISSRELLQRQFREIEESFESNRPVLVAEEALLIVDTATAMGVVAFTGSLPVLPVLEKAVATPVKKFEVSRSLAIPAESTKIPAPSEAVASEPSLWAALPSAEAKMAKSSVAEPSFDVKPAPNADVVRVDLGVVSTTRHSRMLDDAMKFADTQVRETRKPSSAPAEVQKVPDPAPKTEVIVEAPAPAEVTKSVSVQEFSDTLEQVQSSQSALNIQSIQVETTAPNVDSGILNSHGDSLESLYKQEDLPRLTASADLFGDQRIAARLGLALPVQETASDESPEQPPQVEEQLPAHEVSVSVETVEEKQIEDPVVSRAPAVLPFETENQQELPNVLAAKTETESVQKEMGQDEATKDESVQIDLEPRKDFLSSVDRVPVLGQLVATSEPSSEKGEQKIVANRDSQTPKAEGSDDQNTSQSSHSTSSNENSEQSFADSRETPDPSRTDLKVSLSSITLFDEPLQPIPNASIALRGYGKSELSQENGRAYFESLSRSGSWYFSVKAPGYWTTQIETEALKTSDPELHMGLYSEEFIRELAKSLKIDVNPAKAIIIGSMEHETPGFRADVAIHLAGAVAAQGPFYFLNAGIPTRTDIRTSELGMYVYFNVDPGMVLLRPDRTYSPSSLEAKAGHVHRVRHAKSQIVQQKLNFKEALTLHPNGMEFFQKGVNAAVGILGEKAAESVSLSSEILIPFDRKTRETLRVTSPSTVPMWMHNVVEGLTGMNTVWKSLPVVPKDVWEDWLAQADRRHQNGKGHLLISLRRPGNESMTLEVLEGGETLEAHKIFHFDEMGNIDQQASAMNVLSLSGLVVNMNPGEKIVVLKDPSGAVVATTKCPVGSGWLTWTTIDY